MSKIFQIIGKNPNESLTIEEFVESYVFYEEQLKIKIKKVEKFLDDLTQNKKRFEEEKNHAQENEQQKENGLTNQSNLFITIIDGKEFDSGEIMDSCNPFVQIKFQGNMQQSLVKKNTKNPEWNENFKFDIKSRQGNLKVEVLNETYLGNKSFGYIIINLNDLINQEEMENWFNLNTGKGKIRMKIICILNMAKYYENQLIKTIKELKNCQKIYDEFIVYETQMKTPFGIIYTKNLEPLLDDENLRNSENMIDNIRSHEKNIFASEKRDFREYKSIDNINRKLKWNNLTQILMIILIFVSFFTLLERSDFLNLFLAILIFILFLIDKKSNIEKFLQPLILAIGFSLIYDFIWFITQFDYFILVIDHPERKIKRLIYLFSIGNFLIKACLVKGLNDLKRKHLYSNFSLNN